MTNLIFLEITLKRKLNTDTKLTESVVKPLHTAVVSPIFNVPIN
jgi:hypothetical protein